MTKLNHTEARILRNLVNNADTMRWLDMSGSAVRSALAMEKKGLCRWVITPENVRVLEITAKGTEALKGPIE